MTINNVLAELLVRDLDAALPWYERFFDRPADSMPMPGLAEWQLTQGGGVQVFQDPEHAGGARATLIADDLSALVVDLRRRGIEVDDPTTGTGARFTQVTDPDGNTVVLAGALPD